MTEDAEGIDNSRLDILLRQASTYTTFLAEKLQAYQEQHGKHSAEDLHQSSNDTIKPLFTGGFLMSHQIEAVDWLAGLWENGLNGILADEMGLGKTITCIAWLCRMRERGVTSGCFLVICPLGVVRNWMAEIEKFAPGLQAYMYHGLREERRKELGQMVAVKKHLDVVVTSYETVLADAAFLTRHLPPLKYVMIDEAHRLKNIKSILRRVLQSRLLSSSTMANKLLLTGTPLQNNIRELWSLLNFVLPAVFDDLDAFEAWFYFEAPNRKTDKVDEAEEEGQESKPIDDTKAVDKLHALLKPFVLRRMKADVLHDQLPPKREFLVLCPMLQTQQKLYDFIIDGGKAKQSEERILTGKRARKHEFSEEEHEIHHPDMCDLSSRHIPLANTIMQLRKACNDVRLFDKDVDNANSKNTSGKMVVLMQLIQHLLQNKNGQIQKHQHKVIVFSQMARMLDLIEDDLSDALGVEVLRIDGQVSGPERHEIVKHIKHPFDTLAFFHVFRSKGLMKGHQCLSCFWPAHGQVV